MTLTIGSNVIRSEKFLSSCLSTASRFALITDHHIAQLYGKTLVSNLNACGMETHLISIEAGEEHKTRRTKEWIEDQLYDLGMNRDSAILALGGGVITDIAGFVAATYCRGIPCIMIPTTLLAMIDASIGGKNGVNLKSKNFIGTIAFPKHTFIDLDFLTSLPAKEWRNGMAEMVKYQLISTAIPGRSENLQESIESCVSLKLHIVQTDPYEKGLRRILNFGHTIGHAVEMIDHIGHGDAIAIGMLTESWMSHLMGLLPKEEFSNIAQLISSHAFPLALSSQVTKKRLLELLQRDKKSLRSTPRFVLLEKIGKVHSCNEEYCVSVDDDVLSETLSWLETTFKT